jgi:hypothetical protein
MFSNVVVISGMIKKKNQDPWQRTGIQLVLVAPCTVCALCKPKIIDDAKA